MVGNQGRAHGRMVSNHGHDSRGHRGRGHHPPPTHRGGGQGGARGFRGGHHLAPLESGHEAPLIRMTLPEASVRWTWGHGASRGHDQRPCPPAPGSGRGAGRSFNHVTRDDTPGHSLEEDQGNQKRKRKDPSVKRECTICSEEHFTNQCPLQRGPKPTVAYGGAAEDGLGFFRFRLQEIVKLSCPLSHRWLPSLLLK
jgi:hypothetical protein